MGQEGTSFPHGGKRPKPPGRLEGAGDPSPYEEGGAGRMVCPRERHPGPAGVCTGGEQCGVRGSSGLSRLRTSSCGLCPAVSGAAFPGHRFSVCPGGRSQDLPVMSQRCLVSPARRPDAGQGLPAPAPRPEGTRCRQLRHHPGGPEWLLQNQGPDPGPTRGRRRSAVLPCGRSSAPGTAFLSCGLGL